MSEGKEQEKTIYGQMSCGVCGKEEGKRCAGCGTVAYCGKECQKAQWKDHKRTCRRKKLEMPAQRVEVPYKTI